VLIADGNAFQENQGGDSPSAGVNDLVHPVELLTGDDPSGQVSAVKQGPQRRGQAFVVVLRSLKKKRTKTRLDSPVNGGFIQVRQSQIFAALGGSLEERNKWWFRHELRIRKGGTAA
jgi:hypothetical protein